MITIDLSRCTRCNRCTRECLTEAVLAGPALAADHALRCIRCGHCAAACPVEAITIDGLDACRPLPPTSLTSAALLAHLMAHRSGRHYRPEPLATAHLSALLEAASLAPSGLNARVVRARIYCDPQQLAAIRNAILRYYRLVTRALALPGATILARLGGHRLEDVSLLRAELAHLTDPAAPDDRLFYHAPALLVFTSPTGHPTAEGDAWLASYNAMLYADTIPLATCYNGFLALAASRSARVRAALQLPRGERVVTALTAGYPSATFLRCPPRPAIPADWP